MISFRTLKASEIDVKVKKVTESGVVLLLYKTSRTDMDLLDETVGSENWQDEYKSIKDNLYCNIKIKCGDEWIGKEDCGIESREDGGNEKKGEASDAFKRAGFKWGIGRELYTSPFIFVSSDAVPVIEKEFKGKKSYYLKNSFTRFSVSKIGYNENREINLLEIKADKNVVWEYGTKRQSNELEKPVNPHKADTVPPYIQKMIDNVQNKEELRSIYKLYSTDVKESVLGQACQDRIQLMGW